MCSGGLPGCVHFNASTVALRFEYLRTVPAVQELDIWCNLPASYWWPHLRAFLSESWPKNRALKADDEQQWLNPLADLPPLERTHHSWPICRDGVASSPWPTPIDSSNEAMADHARITHAFPLSVAFGGQWEHKQPWPFNHTELREAVRLCARSNASLSLQLLPLVRLLAAALQGSLRSNLPSW